MVRLLLFICLFPVTALAQDITGTWEGYLETSGSKLIYELVINQDGDQFSGYALTIFKFDGTENIGIKTIKLNKRKGQVTFEDGEMIYNNYSTPPRRVKLFADLHLGVSQGLMTMRGSFFTRSLDMRARNENEFVGTIRLQKQNTNRPSKLLAKLEELHQKDSLLLAQKDKQPVAPVLANNNKEEKKEASAEPKEEKTPQPDFQVKNKTASVSGKAPELKVAAPTVTKRPAFEVVNRKTEVIQNVSFDSDSLILSLYDNGEVDGDTVSVILNNQVIIARKGLNTQINRYVVHVTPELSESLSLVLYAENLGRIAPNTGLLVIQDGNNRIEIRFEGDLQKNAAVILRRRR
jgi:hypothetical protein